VVVDGQVVGTWGSRRAGGRLDVLVTPFAGPEAGLEKGPDVGPGGLGPGDLSDALGVEADDLAAFLGHTVRLVVAGA
jgi:hypothetical protein